LGKFITLLAPFVPHFAEEIWEAMGNTQSIFETGQWPEYDPNIVQESTIEVPVQINGRVRDIIIIERDAPKDEVIQKAKASAVIKGYIEGNKIYKEIYIPQKVINFVVIS
jgi:leucyl-tRNA synthetase